MNKTYLITALIFQFLILNGCVNQKYTSYIQCELQPTDVDAVKIITGNMGEAKNIAEKANMPHLSAKEQFIMHEEAINEYRRQLGSNDYILVGEMFVGGDAYSSMEDVRKIMTKRAAKEGGDVVLVFNSGVDAQPRVYTSPGHSTSKAYSSLHGSAYGNFTYVFRQATTAELSNAFSYSLAVRNERLRLDQEQRQYKPDIQGIIFKYNRGREERYQKIILLTDEQFQKFIDHFSVYDEDFSCEPLWDEVDEYLNTNK